MLLKEQEIKNFDIACPMYAFYTHQTLCVNMQLNWCT